MAEAENTPTPRHQPFAFVWEDDPDHWCNGEYVPLHGPLTRRMSRFTEDRIMETMLCLIESGVDPVIVHDLILTNRPGQYLRCDA